MDPCETDYRWQNDTPRRLIGAPGRHSDFTVRHA